MKWYTHEEVLRSELDFVSDDEQALMFQSWGICPRDLYR